jgi:hypothetical protein
VEQLDLTAPLPPQGTTVINSNAHVGVTLSDQEGGTVHCAYDGAEAAALMLTLNTANLSVKSLHKRTIEKLQADGKLPAGTITGTP